MKCLNCHREIVDLLSLQAIFSWQPIFQATICQHCLRQFKRLDKKDYCRGCCAASQSGICADCQRWERLEPPLLYNRALFHYGENMAAYFMNYKGRGDYQLRQLFQSELKQYFYHRTAIFVPIPSDPKHLATRGFNPVNGLFSDILPLTELLLKTTTTLAQAQKTRIERLASPQFFTVNPDISLQVDKKLPIVLLDDIYTTGRTLYHARDCLRVAGFKQNITSFTLAR